MEKLALVFPGQGSQTVGMAKDFCENFKEARLVFEEASDAIRLDLKKLCFDGPMAELTLTPNLQPALFTAEAAMLASLRTHTDLDVVVTAGHSLGEYSAIHAAGALTVADGARITRRRGEAMQRAVPEGRGAMAVIIGLETKLALHLCAKAQNVAQGEVIEPANFNAPGQVVIAGTAEGVAQAAVLVKGDAEFKGGRVMNIPVSAPFHCSLMAPAQKELAPELAKLPWGHLRFPVLCNVTAQPTTSQHELPGLLTDQITRSVRWDDSMRALRSLGVQRLVEVGPGKVLTGLMKRIDKEMHTINVSTVEQLKESFK